MAVRTLILLFILTVHVTDVAVADSPPGTAQNSPREPALLSVVGKDFVLGRTAHFLIARNTSEPVYEEFAGRLESVYDEVLGFLDANAIPHTKPDRRLEVCLFETHAGFGDYAASIGSDIGGISGFYDQQSNRAAFFRAINDPRLRGVDQRIDELEKRLVTLGASGDTAARESATTTLRDLQDRRRRIVESVNRLVVRHEVAHMVLFNVGVHKREGVNPLWLVEGLACVFETPGALRGSGGIAVNTFRLRDLRECLSGDRRNGAPGSAAFEAACESKRLVPLRRLISDRAALDPDDPNIAYRYAQAWSLVAFLHARHRDNLIRYITDAAQRAANTRGAADRELEVFEAFFGRIDAEFECAWTAFTLSLTGG